MFSFSKELIMKELTTKANVECLDTVTSFIDEELESLGCPPKAQIQIDVAIDEIFSNIAYYAYEDGNGLVTVQIEKGEDSPGVNITFIDSGTPYDPLKREDPDTTLSASDRQIGGLGIFIVKKTMDSVIYEYKDGHNILRIFKLF